MNLIIPMAGRGSRFANRGVTTPKPLVTVAGKPMVVWALESVAALLPTSNVVFVVLKEMEAQYGVREILRKACPYPFTICEIPEVTEGQLCTVLAALPYLDVNVGTLIASADTRILSNIAADIAVLPPGHGGLIQVARMPGEQWSFARPDETGRVVEVAEKKRISEFASTGLYYFGNTRQLKNEGEAMIAANQRTRGEFYVMPLYQRLIDAGAVITLSLATEVSDLGTPEGVKAFEAELERVSG